MSENTSSSFRGGNRGRGRGRGRGGRNNNPIISKIEPGTGSGIASGIKSSLSSSSSSTSTTTTTTTVTNSTPTDKLKHKQIQTLSEPENESDICFICASAVIHTSISPCGHISCHICSLRMRALYKTKACAHCRTESDFVIFTDQDKHFEDYSDQDIIHIDSNLGIKYAGKEIQQDTLLLLRYNCPDEKCDVACFGWPDLHRHVKSIHGKVMCDLCTRHKKVFTHEHELFTKDELKNHEQIGDDKPGTIDQSGFRGHPLCGFCKNHFYNDDDLYTHCREKHERCHICDRRNGGQPVYFKDYELLQVHFRKDHFLCRDEECLQNKFVVFESEMDLQAHRIQVHSNNLNRDSRKVDMSSFNYRESYELNNRGRANNNRGNNGRGNGGGRFGNGRGNVGGRDNVGGRENAGGRGRGRDPNVDPIPTSSAQPLRRDEIAFQRSLALRTNIETGRPFQGNLTSDEITPASSNTNATSSSITQHQSTTKPQNKEEELRNLRHQIVIDKAKIMLKNDEEKLSTFRTNISKYKSSSMTSNQLIDSFFKLFDTTSLELGKLIKELADIFEINNKRDQLLKSWNDWKAINEDYPSLPITEMNNSSLSTSKTTSTHGGNRVLKLKNSTTQSSQSTINKAASWGITPSPTKLFNTKPPKNNATTSTPWVGNASASASASSSLNKLNIKKKSESSSDVNAFPSLPPSEKPQFSKPNPYSKFKGSNTVTNAWTKLNDNELGNSMMEEEKEEGNLNEKGKGKKKQTIIHWG